jgi:HPt (histidine-containing phosphotransfer) domain-containing protein
METIDAEVVRQLAQELSPATLRSVIGTFEADLGRLAQELMASGQSGDATGYRRAAHSIAGASAAVGALRLAREARLAMNPAHDEPPHVVMPRIMREAQAAIGALRDLLG